MQETARLAGFFAADAIRSVSTGGRFLPMMGYEQAGGDRAVTGFGDGDPGISALNGQEALESNEFGATRAALIITGIVHLAATRTDALIVRAVSYFPERSAMAVAVPFRPHDDPDGFAVHPPRFLGFDNVDREQFAKLADAFHEGIGSNGAAAALWHAHMEEVA